MKFYDKSINISLQNVVIYRQRYCTVIQFVNILNISHLLQYDQGWAPHSFPFGTFCSFPFFKRNVPFCSVLFSSFWRLMRPKRMLHSFPFFSKECKESNIPLRRTEKNARTFFSFAKERENVQFFFQYI